MHQRMPSPRKALLACLVLASSLAILGCGSNPGGAGPGRRPQDLVLTPEQELSLGRQAYREILSQVPVARGGPDVDRVRTVGRRLVQAAGIEPLQREMNLRMKEYRYEWEFNVINDKQVNAFCLPGGKVAVFVGLLRVAQNDDQLATVMSHEIAHALAHHSNERIARYQRRHLAIGAAAGALDAYDRSEREQLIGLLSPGASLRGIAFDRFQESEADHIGLFLMTFAGFDPTQSVVFWQRMRAASGRSGTELPEILSTHPSDARRIAQLKNWVPYAKGAKKAYDEGRVVHGPRR